MKTTLTAFVSSLGLALAATALTACGAEEKNSSKDDETTAESGTSDMLADESVASEGVSSSVDEAIANASEASANNGESAAMALALADEAPLSGKAKAVLFRECKVDGDKAVVEVRRSVDRSASFNKGGRSGSLSFKDLFESKRTWSKEGANVACSANGKHAAIEREALEGYAVSAAFKVERSRSASFTDRKGRTSSRDASIKAEGTRNLAWKSVAVEGDVIKLTTEVKSSAKRDVQMKNKDGKEVAFSKDIKTDDAAPLVILTERSKSDGRVLSRTIQSGKKIATGKDGGRVETTFKDVKYVRADGCYPLSGSIEGAIYAKDAKEAGATFVVAFTGTTKVVTFTMADGSKKESEYVAEGCAFESERVQENPGSTQEASAKSEVK